MAAGKRRAPLWIGAAVVAAAAVAVVLAVRGGAAGPPETAGPAPPLDRPAAGRPSDAGPATATPDRDATSPVPATAPGLVGAARTEAAAGHYVQALALYQRAYELDPAPSTLLDVGRMLHLTGRCREARRTTQRVLAASPPADLAAAAQEQLDKIGRCD